VARTTHGNEHFPELLKAKVEHGLWHELVFGTFLTPAVENAERVIALAQLTEQVGLDLVTVQDHPYQPR
jgi:predicted Zn-dependent protease